VDHVEHAPPLLERVLQTLAVTEVFYGAPADPSLVDPSPRYRALIQEVITRTALAGGCVIVAHGAGVLLAGMSGVLRVFVTASPAVRAERVMAERGCSAREATRAVEWTDHERAAYLQRFYGVSREQPTQYDLVVNTDRLTAQDAARIIVSAARVSEPEYAGRVSSGRPQVCRGDARGWSERRGARHDPADGGE